MFYEVVINVEVFAMVNSLIRKMFGIDCPQCKKHVSFLVPKSFEQWRYGLVHCKHCGSDLKASNTLFLACLYGLFCGAMITSSNYWKFGTGWLRFLVVIGACWYIVFPLLNRFLGHWQVVMDLSQIKHPPPIIRRWSLYANLSFWLSVVTVLSGSVIGWFCIKQMQRDLSSADQASEQLKTKLVDEAARWPQIMMAAMFICIVLAGAFFVMGIVCHIKSKKSASVASA